MGYYIDLFIYRRRRARIAAGTSAMIDVRMFTVGPVAENCFVLRREGCDRGLIVDPGEEADRILAAVERDRRRRSRRSSLTHTHFDHVGAVAPVATATGAPVYCPELETPVLADIMAYVPWPGFGPFESYEADQTVEGGETLELAGLTFDVIFTPGHSPGHVTYSVRDEEALFSGDVLFQGSVGRIDLPGGDGPTLLESIRTLIDSPRRRRGVYPGPHGVDDARRRARHQSRSSPSSRAEPSRRAGKVAPRWRAIQAPRGTFDVLPADAPRAAADRGRRRSDLRPRRLRADRDAGLRGHRAVRARRRRLDRHRQKEMYTFEDGGGRCVTLRPEGTAPVCRAYIEHGMHKLPQPVKLWYLSPFFRPERPQAGRYRQFWQVGAEAIGADAPLADAEAIVLLAELLDALGRPGVGCGSPASARPRRARAYREELKAYLRAHEGELSEDVRERIDLNPMRAFDANDAGTRGGDGGRAEAARPPRGRGRRALRRRCARCSTRPGVAYEIDPTLVRGLDYYTRTVFEFICDALGAQSEVGGGGRYDGLIEQLGGPPTPASAGRPGSSGSCWPSDEARPRRRRRDVFVAVEPTPRQRRRALALATELRRAGLAAQLELAGRSLKGQLKHADRIGAATSRSSRPTATAQLRDMESGEQRPIDPAR